MGLNPAIPMSGLDSPPSPPRFAGIRTPLRKNWERWCPATLQPSALGGPGTLLPRKCRLRQPGLGPPFPLEPLNYIHPASSRKCRKALSGIAVANAQASARDPG